MLHGRLTSNVKSHYKYVITSVTDEFSLKIVWKSYLNVGGARA
jgi:hypothetical protein